jgi:hypothetical protein
MNKPHTSPAYDQQLVELRTLLQTMGEDVRHRDNPPANQGDRHEA